MPKRPSHQRARGAAPGNGGYTPAQISAAVAARDRAAAGNPHVVRGAFLGGHAIKLGELTIQPLTIGTFWLLEDIGSPLAAAEGTPGAGEPVSFRQLAEAAFILTDPAAASDAWSKGKDTFAKAAFAVACRIPIEDMQQLSAALFQRVAEAEKVMPPPDAAAGTNPSVPPAKIPVSAGG